MGADHVMAGTGRPGVASLGAGWRELVSVIRAGDWWGHKVPALLGVAYLAAYAAGLPAELFWPRWLAILVALCATASFVSVLNDLTDLEDDRRAGKANRMTGRTRAFRVGACAGCVGAGLLGASLLRESAVSLALYAGNWLAYTLYSARPVRWKRRGLVGVAADAGGGQLLPTLWTGAFMMGRAWDGSLLWPLGVWAGALGVRGILTHQLLDVENDREARVRTLAVRVGPECVQRWVARAVFPVEVAGLLWLLARTGAWLAWPLLLLYLALAGGMARWLSIRPVLVRSAPGSFRFFLFKYYVTLFPLTFILALAPRFPSALWLAPLHALAFPGGWRRIPHHVHEVWRLAVEKRRVAKAIERGLSYLAAVQYPDGEFHILIDEQESLATGRPDSCVFPTAQVAWSLESCRPAARAMIDRAVTFLHEQMEEGGTWRYNTRKGFKYIRVPPDVDDTACATMVLRSHGVSLPDNRGVFLNNRDAAGLFRTWMTPIDSTAEAFREYLARLERIAEEKAPAKPPEQANNPRFNLPRDPVNAEEIDSVVNANVVYCLGEEAETRPAIDYLLWLVQTHREAGTSFYYTDVMSFYYMLARAAMKSAPSLRAVAPLVTERVAQHLARAEDLSPLSVAQGACALLYLAPGAPELPAAIGRLLGSQGKDGSWPRYSFYVAYTRNPADGGEPFEFWGSEELTTGFCVEALARYAALRK